MEDPNNMEQELIAVSEKDPEYHSDTAESSDFYRRESFWKTEEGFVRIEDMDTEHLVYARRHCMKKVAEHYEAAASHEKKAEVFLLKKRQMQQELERRAIDLEEEACDVELLEQ